MSKRPRELFKKPYIPKGSLATRHPSRALPSEQFAKIFRQKLQKGATKGAASRTKNNAPSRSGIDKGVRKESVKEIVERFLAAKGKSCDEVPPDTGWYIEDEVNHLMRYYAANYANQVTVLPAVMGTHNRAIGGSELAGSLENYMDMRRQGFEVLVPLVLVPVCLDGRHWSAIAIDFHFGGAVQRVRFFDPLYAYDAVPADILRAVRQGLGVDRVATECYAPQVQRDGYNCGPWIVEWMRALIEGKHFNTAVNVDNVRVQQHAQVPGMLRVTTRRLHEEQERGRSFSTKRLSLQPSLLSFGTPLRTNASQQTASPFLRQAISSSHQGAAKAENSLDFAVITWNINHGKKAQFKREALVQLFGNNPWLDVVVLQEINASEVNSPDILLAEKLGHQVSYGPRICVLNPGKKTQAAKPKSASFFMSIGEKAKPVRPSQQEHYPIVVRNGADVQVRAVWAFHGGKICRDPLLYWSKKSSLQQAKDVQDFRPIIVYELRVRGQAVFLGIVHTTPMGSGLARKGEFEQVKGFLKLMAKSDGYWILAGDFYLDPESSTGHKTSFSNREPKVLFHRVCTEMKLNLVTSVSATNQTKLTWEVSNNRIEKNELQDSFWREDIERLVVNKRADFFVCNQTFDRFLAKLLNPRGGILDYDPHHQALNYWSRISDHMPIAGIFSHNGSVRWNRQFRLHSLGPQYELFEHQAGQKLSEWRTRWVLELSQGYNKLCGVIKTFKSTDSHARGPMVVTELYLRIVCQRLRVFLTVEDGQLYPQEALLPAPACHDFFYNLYRDMVMNWLAELSRRLSDDEQYAGLRKQEVYQLLHFIEVRYRGLLSGSLDVEDFTFADEDDDYSDLVAEFGNSASEGEEGEEDDEEEEDDDDDMFE